MSTGATFTLLTLLLSGWLLAFGLVNRHIQATALAVDMAPWDSVQTCATSPAPKPSECGS